MKKYLSKIIIAATVLVVLFLTVRFGFTVVPIAQAEEAAQNEVFDPVSYVDSVWESILAPAYAKDTSELTEILSKFETNSDLKIQKESLLPITKEYGIITVGEAQVYMVKGSGEVIAVNTESSTGTMEVKLDGYDGPIKVLIYIGPRIPSDETSVRDAGDYITFGDFKEQTEYGKVSAAINKRVLSEVIGEEDKAAWVGKKITFSGAFSIRTFNLIEIDLSQISVVPMSLELGE